ncbi:MAG: glycoside hydrolase family 25 protein [Clostridium perfringens]|nr:glycoside hydrolase family 25 protein [Clostridium perfringens]
MQDKTSNNTFGPDINQFTTNVNFNTLARNSDFIYLRASSSSTGNFNVDQNFINYATECRRRGIPCGAYHYGLPSYDLTTADSQCDSFINILTEAFGNNNYGDLFPVLDVEEPLDNTISTTVLINWIERFKNRFETKTRRKLMFYTGLFFIELYNNFQVPNRGYPLSNMPLWIAMYTRIPSNPKYPPNIGGWTRWTMWQYTDQGTLAGIGSPVDLNWGPINLAYLMPPLPVVGLYAVENGNNIAVYWKANSEVDISGYNLFINSLYAGTVSANTTKFNINKTKFSLPKNNAIEISIEAFDYTGDFSTERSTYILN